MKKNKESFKKSGCKKAKEKSCFQEEGFAKKNGEKAKTNRSGNSFL